MINVIFGLTAAGSVTALAALIVTRLFPKLPRRWAYYLWLPVLLRFLVPVGFSLPSAPEIQAIPETVEIVRTVTDTVTVTPAVGEAVEIQPAQPTKTVTVELGSILTAIWLFGAVLFAVRRLSGYFAALHRLRKNRRRLTSYGSLPVYISESTGSPMLVGLIRPKIYVPDGLTPHQLSLALAHESVHARRRDLWYKWLMQLTAAVHWFNPLVYIINNEISELCELSCDEAVAKSLDVSGRRDYAMLLLTLAVGGDPMTAEMAGSSPKRLKERIIKIMDSRKTSHLASILALSLAAVLLITAAVTGIFVSTRASAEGDVVAESTAPEDILDMANSELNELKSLGILTYDLSLTAQDVRANGTDVDGDYFSVYPDKETEYVYIHYNTGKVNGYIHMDPDTGKIVNFYIEANASARDGSDFGALVHGDNTYIDTAALLCTYWGFDSAQVQSCEGSDLDIGVVVPCTFVSGSMTCERYFSEYTYGYGFGYAYPLG